MHSRNPEGFLRAVASTRPINRARMVAALRRAGPMPRVALARATGLSFAAVSAITAELMAEGVLLEGAPDPTKGRGRPTVDIDLNPSYGRIVALALRMNNVDAMLSDFRGRPIARHRRTVATRALTDDSLRQVLIDEARAVSASDTGGGRLLGVGVALQGVVDATGGRQLWSPALSCTGTEIAGTLSRALGGPVVMGNDAVAMSVGLAAADPELARGPTATIMAGHGVGMGLLIDGHPALGDGGVASEIGHIKVSADGPQCRCGQRGCIEAYLADYALYRDARTFLDLPPAEAQQPTEAQMTLLHERARAGDVRLDRLYRQAGHALAAAVAVAVSVLDPRHVVLTGPIMEAFPMMREAYEARLAETVLPWLLTRTRIHVRPCGTDMIVEGMALRTLAEIDRKFAGPDAVEPADRRATIGG